jgi:putative flippase GtrA
VTPLATRWVKFSAVGVLGIGVQMGCFAVLFSGFHVNYMVATALSS